VNPATRWILAIVGLLAANVIAQGVLIAASHSGASQVIPSYYDKAVHYDDQIDQARRNTELGWPVVATADHGTIAITGAPAGATVSVTGYPRAHADRPFALTGARVASPAHGWLDLTITVDRNGDHFVQHQALEVP
jgi:nitrogen fixation protein FixH